MQPVNLLMSNLNVEASARHAPNALAAAQETGQSQEIIRDGIRIVQTVQASEAMSNAQRVHRKNSDEQQQGRQGQEQNRDSYEHSQNKEQENESPAANTPLIRENVRSKKSFEFLA